MADPVPQNATTPNYAFNQPAVGGDDNVWGGLLNDNWASIDSILWNVSGVANAALTQGAGDARYLRLTGGSIGPNSFIVNGPAQFNNYAAFSGSQPTVFQTQAQFTGGATFGTAQVFFNSVVTFSADALGVTPTAGDNSQRFATTAFVAGAIAAIPVPPVPPAPSNNAPLMNGTANAGLLAIYSRGDHVHPSDTSRLSLAGGTLTGPLILSADPTANLQPATKQYVDAMPGANLGFGGYVNKLRNSGFDVWQRGATVAVPAAGSIYTADGWVVGIPSSTAGVNVVLGTGLTGSYSRSSLGVQGAAGVPTVNLQQRIESYIAAHLAGRQCTFQARVWNNTPNPITPTVLSYIPTAQDNFTALTADLASTNLQTIAAGATAVVSCTFPVGAGATAGYVVMLGFGGALNALSRAIYVTDVDFRATPGVPVGLNANPPPPELRNIAIETVICERYFQVIGNTAIGGYQPGAGSLWGPIVYHTRMRVNPTATIVGTPAYANASALVFASLNPASCYANCSVAAAGNATCVFTVSFGAEL